jgi:hypothetical protein
MLEDFFNAKSFSTYIGKALLVLVTLAPLTYCQVQADRSSADVEISELELQKACIEQRGTWDSRRESCTFDD